MRVLFFSLLLVSSNSFADMAMRAQGKMAASLAAPAPTYQVTTTDIKAHNQSILNLLTVAEILKVKDITAYSNDAGSIRPSNVTEAMKKKMIEHPKWDVSLSPAELQTITPHLELLKNTFGEKTYGWAWFLRQTGKTAEAKKVLADLFAERSAAVMMMEGTYHQQGPLIPVLEIEQALAPLSTADENAKMQKKMQELKVHVSNLKDYMINT
jgi:hypothetical protein